MFQKKKPIDVGINNYFSYHSDQVYKITSKKKLNMVN